MSCCEFQGKKMNRKSGKDTRWSFLKLLFASLIQWLCSSMHVMCVNTLAFLYKCLSIFLHFVFKVHSYSQSIIYGQSPFFFNEKCAYDFFCRDSVRKSTMMCWRNSLRILYVIAVYLFFFHTRIIHLLFYFL